MKRILLLLCFVALFGEASSQTPSVTVAEEAITENMPAGQNAEPAKFRGGSYHDFEAWVGERLSYRRAPGKRQRQKVSASFNIDAEGRLTDVKVLRKPAGNYYRKLAAVLEQSPPWTPGTESGEPVSTEYAVEIDLVARSVKVASLIDGEFVMPVFPKPKKYHILPPTPRERGGFPIFAKWAMQQLVYPLAASSRGIEGTVMVAVEIDQKGRLSVMEVKSTPHTSLANEVVRVIDKQEWMPGTLDGIEIPMYFILPFEFKL